MEKLHNTINGEQVAPRRGDYLDNIEPATGVAHSATPNSTSEDLEAAIDAATAAFASWSQATTNQRARALTRIADLIDEHREPLAQAESKDTGKPITLARTVDIPRAADNFRFFAHACTQFAGESHSMGAKGFNYTLREPLGVVACISPWNLPLYLLTWKIAPALAAVIQ